jgi:4-amino-4-deoxy-L-arabinose transferase-like glycosyltransferase
MAGYFFFGMATYTLCPLLGVKAFALSPDKMIQYGLEAEAASLAFHILTELVLGWIFTALSLRKEKDVE